MTTSQQLRTKVKQRKFRNQLTNLLAGAWNKSRGCKRMRPGKQKSTFKTLDKKLDKLELQYNAAGLGELCCWTEFMKRVMGTTFGRYTA